MLVKKYQKSQKKALLFTLVEVLVALVITVMGITLIANIMNRSQRQIIEIQRTWSNTHLLSLATEHYLVFGHKVAPPSDLFPQGISVFCRVGLAPPSSLMKQPKLLKGWVLARYTVSLFLGDELIKEQNIDKIIPQKAL